MNRPYPKPKDAGGRLIRLAIATLRGAGVKLPLTSDILIGVSGGADSVALATLISRYGRRITGEKKVHWIHVNHGWRGKESDADARFVKELGRRLGVNVRVRKLGRNAGAGESWEAAARAARNEIFEREAGRLGAVVLTAHHADDLAETVLWRILTGAASTHAGGILVQDGRTIRPFLRARKLLLKKYLKEEGLTWREDRTNHEGRFMRARMRKELMPALEAIFPRAIEHLTELGLGAQNAARSLTAAEAASSLEEDVLAARLGALGIRLRRAHLKAKQPVLQLPKGWKLVRAADSR